MSEREFRGIWIPATIWLDERLSPFDKIILAEIDSLDGEGGCFATNAYLAKFCDCSERKVTQAISKLAQLGYLAVWTSNTGKRVMHTNLSRSEKSIAKIAQQVEEAIREGDTDEGRKKCDPPLEKNATPLEKSATPNTNSIYNNIYNNNIKEINNNSILAHGQAVRPQNEDFEKPYTIRLPLRDGTMYKVDTQYISQMQDAFPKVDIMQELRKMNAWLISNPEKQK
ncbi:MAG: helix-turn-helix domain-containing protein, partial [Oscillospiraceae bacterium]|nr:helix-turn-helix domain-containing protein [Oscillospiraceae bacterium]